MKQKNIKGLISEYFIFLIFIALVVVLTCLKPSFIAPTNLVNILKQASINGILAFGMTVSYTHLTLPTKRIV